MSETKKHSTSPGTKGGGNFYRITVRPKSEFVLFRNHDIGKAGHIERIAGKRKDGSWDTQCWLVDKKDAKIVNNCLVGNNSSVRDLFSKFKSAPKLIEGSVFSAKNKKKPNKDSGIRIEDEKYKQKKKNPKYDEDPLLIQ